MALGLFLLGGVLAILPWGVDRRRIQAGFGLAVAAGVVGALQAGDLLVSGASWQATLSVPGFTSATPYTVLGLQEDALGAFFVLLISVVGGAISLASIGYVDHYVLHRRPALTALFLLFLGTLLLVSLAGTVFLFFLAWEGMTLVSYFLVVHEQENWEARRAGIFYLVMSHVAGAAVLGALLALAAETGTAQFSQMAARTGQLPELVRDGIFVAVVVGFGTKAGMVPVHVWLPEAHPAAPSNVSALMSGVMIKMGIYGMLRFGVQILGPGPEWWGFLLLGLGALSAFLGVLYAIAQHDLKRLLAFHSIENIGIILIALGASLVFESQGYPLLAALALLAGLFHTLNHALFKALLFLGAGAAVGAVGTRDVERMGGLARAMPTTALGFLVGAMAISALPPFNGFVSEWLLFQSLFGGFSTGNVLLEVTFAFTASLLALSSGLAAYCFVKAFGIVFLAHPRSEPARTAQEAPGTLRAGLAVLSTLCLVFGIAPALLLSRLGGVTAEITGQSVVIPSPWNFLGSLPTADPTGAGLAMGVVALLLAVGLVVAWIGRTVTASGRDTAVASGPAWDCGIDQPTSRMEYTASGYAQPVERIFGSFYSHNRSVERGEVAETRLEPIARPRRLLETIGAPFREAIYAPIEAGFYSLAQRISRLQSGGIHAYLTYILLTLVALLLVQRLIGGGG